MKLILLDMAKRKTLNLKYPFSGNKSCPKISLMDMESSFLEFDELGDFVSCDAANCPHTE